jgi:hypothetical protein
MKADFWLIALCLHGFGADKSCMEMYAGMWIVCNREVRRCG